MKDIEADATLSLPSNVGYSIILLLLLALWANHTHATVNVTVDNNFLSPLTEMNYGHNFTGFTKSTLPFVNVETRIRLTGSDGTGLSVASQLEFGSNEELILCLGWVSCAWSFDTLNLNFQEGVDYTLEITGTDNFDITVEVIDFTYIGERVKLTLDMDLHTTFVYSSTGSDAIDATVSFRSERRPEFDVSGEVVEIFAKHRSAGSTQFSLDTVVLGANGTANFSIILPESVPSGAYEITAEILGAGKRWGDTDSNVQSLYAYENSVGYAVIIEGATSSNEGQDSYTKTTSRVYQALLDRLFEPNNILYISPDTLVDGVDLSLDAGFAAIQAEIINLAGQVNSSPAPVYFFLIDHGEFISSDANLFLMSNAVEGSGFSIGGVDLAGIIDSFESSIGTAAGIHPRVFINGFCYAEGFFASYVDTGMPSPRVNISTAAFDEKSYRGLPEPVDGIRPGEFFVEEIVEYLRQGGNLRDSFGAGAEQTKEYTKSLIPGFIDERFNDDSVQHPLLDDNSDYMGANAISDVLDPAIDGSNSYFFYMGADRTQGAQNPAPEFEGLEDATPVVFPSSASQAEICAPVELLPADGALYQLDVQVREPGTVLNHSTTFGTFQDEYAFQSYSFVFDENDPNVSASGEYCFDIAIGAAGRYDVFYRLSRIAPTAYTLYNSKNTFVYKQSGGNTAPSEPTHITPVDSSQVDGLVAVLRWQASVDAEGHSIKYAVEVCNNFAMNEGCEIYTDVEENFYGLTGLNGSLQYFWRITAYDELGATATQGTPWSFRPGSTNAPTGLLFGYVQSKTNLANYLSGANIAGSTNSTITDAEGAYLMELNRGSLTIDASKANYAAETVQVFIYENQIVDQGFLLGPDSDDDGIEDIDDNCPNTPNPEQMNFDGDAQGDVCDADDDNDGISDIDEISNGLNPFDPLDAPADYDDDGLSNSDEINIYFTMINNPDTDNDGFTDGEEVASDTDPNDPNSFPGAVQVPVPWPVPIVLMCAFSLLVNLTRRGSTSPARQSSEL